MHPTRRPRHPLTGRWFTQRFRVSARIALLLIAAAFVFFRLALPAILHPLTPADDSTSTVQQADEARERNRRLGSHVQRQDRLEGDSEREHAGWSEGSAVSGATAASATVTLSNGVKMPRLGFGTAGLGDSTQQAVLWALEAGYRLIDSAQAREWYREDAVGAAIAASHVARKDLFIVSKLHPRHSGYAIALQRVQDSLSALNTPYLDLFLLHYPYCFAAICGGEEEAGTVTARWRDSWRGLEEAYRQGLLRAIGVSNFGEKELSDLLAVAQVKPHVVQRYSDPLRADTAVQSFCRRHGIAYMAYSSLGSQWTAFATPSTPNPVLTHPTITAMAAARNCTPAQVVLKWGYMHDQIVIPRSSKRDHILDNYNALGCRLQDADIASIDALDGTHQG